MVLGNRSALAKERCNPNHKLVVLYLYGQFDNLLNGQEIHLGFVTTVAGLWAFVLAGYWLFWKLLGADKAVKGLIAQWKKKRKK